MRLGYDGPDPPAWFGVVVAVLILTAIIAVEIIRSI